MPILAQSVSVSPPPLSWPVAKVTLRARWRRHQEELWQAYADRMKKDPALLAEAEA